ncbi:hypothetical protein MFIFM68171_02143 [Madurella fahalii]|uniref:Aminoglycoside phosphotransferase domain-containing protein n=1 Tax=Madurella fahalii TaxID=1157608 RepID=A0ABQ0G2D9_9PEZI
MNHNHYDPKSLFKYNNFVYRITSHSLISSGYVARSASLSPGCVPIPEGTKELIIRLTNPHTEGMSMANRVENEVAIMSLTSAALSHFRPRVDSYEASFKARLERALWKADANPYIKGWRANGLRYRLDKFVAEGIPAQFTSLSLKQDKVIIHTDFGLIDYDFASILYPSYKFLRSFDGAGGQFRGWYVNEESEEAALREAKLHGFPSALPATKPDWAVNWEDAKAWEGALEAAGVTCPRTIQGIDKVADVDKTEETIMKCRDQNEQHLDKLLSRLGF